MTCEILSSGDTHNFFVMEQISLTVYGSVGHGPVLYQIWESLPFRKNPVSQMLSESVITLQWFSIN